MSLDLREIADFHVAGADEVCAICLEGCSEENPGIRLQRRFIETGAVCGHIFHRTCINRWVSENPSCPECHRGLEVSFTLGDRIRRVGRDFDERIDFVDRRIEEIDEKLTELAEKLLAPVSAALDRLEGAFGTRTFHLIVEATMGLVGTALVIKTVYMFNE